MNEPRPIPQSTLGIVADALSYPLLKKLSWWLIVVGCATAAVFLYSSGLLTRSAASGRLVLLVLFLIGLAVRCYFSVIETTLTGYGEEAWQGNGLRTDELWSSMGTVALLALMCWAPAIATGFWLHHNEMALEPWTSLLGCVGCEYFTMAVIGTVVFGGMTGAMPQYVLPAIVRCGAAYSLGALGLLLIPWTFQWTLPEFRQYGIWGVVIACAFASYFLIVQARLAGLIYVVNREKIGWD